jgi:hypothetical protein
MDWRYKNIEENNREGDIKVKQNPEDSNESKIQEKVEAETKPNVVKEKETIVQKEEVQKVSDSSDSEESSKSWVLNNVIPKW